MPRIGPLTPAQAKATLAQRLGRVADNVRQIATILGARPYRVFLVWTKWSGQERGEGQEAEIRRVEILPTPRVANLDAITFSLYHAGTLPVGSVKVDRISVVSFSSDLLTGNYVPAEHEDFIPEPYEFMYEVVEDGRGDNPPTRSRFRLLSFPFRRATQVDWTIMLERVGEDRNRYAQGQTPEQFSGPRPGIPANVTGPRLPPTYGGT
jgi:hypothetical protein